MIRGVFFDLYGTLLIYGEMSAAWSDWLGALHGVFRDRGLTLGREAFARQCDGLFGEAEPPPEGNLTVYERRLGVLCRRIGMAEEPDLLRRAAEASIAAWEPHLTLDPAAHAVLAGLQESKSLALISNYDHPPHAHALLAKLDLTRYFSAVVISGELGVKKPDPGIFGPALEVTGLEPAEVVYVGDSPEDIQGARAAGLRPILIRRDGQDSSRAHDFRSESDTVREVHAANGTSPDRTIGGLAELPLLID